MTRVATHLPQLSLAELKALKRNAEHYAKLPNSQFHKAALALLPEVLDEIRERANWRRTRF